MVEPTSRTTAAEVPDLAALVRQPAAAAPMRAWQPGVVARSLWQLFSERPMALLGGVLAALLRAGVLLLVSAAVGQVVRGSDVWPWSGAAALGLVLAALLGHAGQRLVIDAVQQGLTRLRDRLVERQLGLSVDAVLSAGVEGFVLAMTRDSELLGQMARACFGALLPGVVLVFLCLGGIAVVLPTLALPLILALVVLWLVRWRLSRRLAGQMASAHQAIDHMYEQLGSMVWRHELAVSQALESHERDACRAGVAHAHRHARVLAGTQAWASEIDALVLGLALLGLLSWVIAAGGPALSRPGLASVLFLLLALRGALQGVVGALQEMALGVPALAGIVRLLALPATQSHEGREPPTRWRVSLDDVSRRVGGRPVIHHVDMALEPGRIAVLTGANGAGKTTLLRVLLGLGDADSGVVRVDGEPWARIDRDAFRRGVGYLPQSAGLFAGTIHDNIAYAVPGASREAVRSAAQAVGLGPSLDALPNGLSTYLGSGGSPLSGGERQRVALARTLLRQPRLLVLDEPTNHMDANGARALMALLQQLPGEPVVLIVSHDPIVIGGADQVFHMADGRVLCSTTSKGE